MSQAHAKFQLSIKGLVIKDGKVLVLKTPDNYIDFPGGRVDVGEESVSHHEILRREIEEELGKGFKYKIGNLAFATTRYFDAGPGGSMCHVLVHFYRLNNANGHARISDEHEELFWVTPKEMFNQKSLKFASQDEERQLKKYFRL